jgi:hypothetical protein
MSAHPNNTFKVTGRMSEHPNITFKVTGHNNENQRFNAFEFELLQKAFPLGSIHAHIPGPQVIYTYQFNDPSPAETLAQSCCRACYKTGELIDNRKAPAAG